MQNYLKLYREQLNNLPNSGYKTQLTKYGESIARDIFSKSIMNLIADIKPTTEDIQYLLPESDFNFKKTMIKPVNIRLRHDLGICEELIYRLPTDTRGITKASNELSIMINNYFMNYVLIHEFTTLSLPLESVLTKRDNPRILIVGNKTIKHLRCLTDSSDLKFIESNSEGDLIFHSCYIPVNTIYSIDILPNNKAIDYLVKNPLTVINNEFRHISGIYLKNSGLITKYLI